MDSLHFDLLEFLVTTYKNVHHPYPSGKSKLQLLWDSIPPPLELLELRWQMVANAVKDEERDIYILLLGAKTRVATKELKVGIPQKLKMNLSYDPTTPLLSICPKDSIFYRDTPSIHNS